MSDWLSYEIADFVPFSAEVYWRLIAGYNAEIRPLHIPALALGAGIVWLMFRPRPWAGRIVAMILALAWAWTGWRFIGEVYGQVHVGAQAIAWAFWVQAGLLLILGLPAGHGSGAGGDLDRAIVLAAIVFYPVLPHFTARPPAAAEFFGLFPDPTALATLGVVAFAANGVRLVVLVIIPSGWIAFSGLTLIALGAKEGWILLAAAAFVLGGLLLRRPSRASERP